MWVIDDEKARDFITSLVPEEEVSDAYEDQRDNYSDWIVFRLYEGQKANAELKVRKSLFKNKRGYEPNKWNPFPEVMPPEDGYYFVTEKLLSYDGKAITNICGYRRENGFISGNKSVITAFRALPEPYDEKEENE